jgi:hypothetical protein
MRFGGGIGFCFGLKHIQHHIHVALFGYLSVGLETAFSVLMLLDGSSKVLRNEASLLNHTNFFPHFSQGILSPFLCYRFR